jgi:hypothetical protein
MAGAEKVEVVVAHHDCVTLRAGEVFLRRARAMPGTAWPA